MRKWALPAALVVVAILVATLASRDSGPTPPRPARSATRASEPTENVSVRTTVAEAREPLRSEPPEPEPEQPDEAPEPERPGRIVGRAFDEHGDPIAGGIVRISRARGPRLAREPEVTNLIGEYRIDDLAAGEYWVQLDPDEDRFNAGDRTRLVELGAGETLTVDFGRPVPLPTWRGTVRSATGERVPGTRAILAVNVETDGRVDLRTLPDGSFEGTLEPGQYRLLVRAFGGWTKSGVLELREFSLERDLVLPAVHVSVQARYVGAWKDSRAAITGQTLFLSHEEGHPSQHATPTGSGMVSFHGVPPGRYHLVAHPGVIVGATDGRLEIEVEQGSKGIRLEVEIDDP